MTEFPSSIVAVWLCLRAVAVFAVTNPIPCRTTLIEQVLEAGRWAASASNRQPWTFIVIRDKAIRKAVAQHAALLLRPLGARRRSPRHHRAVR